MYSLAMDVKVTFYPERWRTISSGDELTELAEDPVTFRVPEEDATDEGGELLESNSYESDALREHESAPEWVRNWEGPFYVVVEWL